MRFVSKLNVEDGIGSIALARNQNLMFCVLPTEYSDDPTVRFVQCELHKDAEIIDYDMYTSSTELSPTGKNMLYKFNYMLIL